MGTQTPPSAGPALFGLAPNVASMITYAPCCVGLFFSIAVAALEKKHQRVVRFNAFQSLLLHGATSAVCFVFWIISWVMAQLAGVLAFLTNMLGLILLLAVMALMVLLMIKAYGGEEIELPLLGELARKSAA